MNCNLAIVPFIVENQLDDMYVFSTPIIDCMMLFFSRIVLNDTNRPNL